MFTPSFCHLCMTCYPESGRLVPVATDDDGALVVAQDENDELTLCEKCIRDVKRFSFEAMRRAPAVPPEIEIPDLPGGDEDIPF